MICDSPYYVKNPKYNSNTPWHDMELPVPCGRCPNCKKRRVNSWVFRLMQEDKVSTSSYFITLTYDDKKITKTKNGFYTLVKKDLQDFWKRGRKTQKSKNKIKYYACGEYGSKTQRPHYHAIVFNVDDIKSFCEKWNNGEVHVGSVSGNSIAYTAKYIDKSTIIPVSRHDDRQKEFSVMSKGLGKSYLTDNIIAYHKADLTRNYVTLEGGVKTPLPRYYRDFIYTEDEKHDQIEIIQDIFEEESRVNRRKYETKYKNRRQDFDIFEHNKKIARWKKFQAIKRQKPRS